MPVRADMVREACAEGTESMQNPGWGHVRQGHREEVLARGSSWEHHPL